MGTVFKRTATKPLPVGAEFFSRKGQRLAKWQDSKGRTRTASVIVPTEGKFAGQERIAVETPTYFADYRDGSGHLRRVATGCRDETAARAVLAGLEKRAEKVRSGIITTAENAMTDHQHTALTDHLAEFIATMQAAGRAESHVTGTERLIQRVIDELSLRRLTDIRAEAVERWLGQQTMAQPGKPAMGARTRNSYLIALRSFCNWCVERDRLPFNPLAKIGHADEKVDQRRQRRALTEAELSKLLIVARLRPLAEFGRETVKTAGQATSTRQKCSRATWTLKPLKFDELPAVVELARERLKDNPTFLARQERLGIERALAYKVAVTTGLRRGELASLTVGQLDLDTDFPHVRLKAADEKNRKGNSIPLRRDMADELREWVSGLRNDGAGSANVLAFRRDAVAVELPASTRLLNIPKAFCKILDRDLKAAGIPKSDDRGRTIDVHALRHTFGTMLSMAGVAPRVAQAVMRHSSIDLTMNVYSDPRLLDVQGAVESLPQISTTSEPNDNRQRMAAGAETFSPSAVAVLVAVP
ncbi:MAG: tyrosine-type recombinase/integrase, partial [Planctomycetaceae bacterium]